MRKRRDVHLVELGAGRDNLLDAELAELRLELAELLHQVILALVPELDSLNLCGRLQEKLVSNMLRLPTSIILTWWVAEERFDGSAGRGRTR